MTLAITRVLWIPSYLINGWKNKYGITHIDEYGSSYLEYTFKDVSSAMRFWLVYE